MKAAKVCSGSSTVPAVVVIVVKYRACLSVSQLIVGISAQLVVYLGRRHIGTKAYIGIGAVYTSIQEWVVVIFRVRQGYSNLQKII